MVIEMQYVKNSNIIEETISETEIMLYNTQSEEVHILNRTATEIYQILLQKKSVKDLIMYYIDLHKDDDVKGIRVKEQELIDDVENMISSLINLDIIKQGEPNE